MFINGVWSLQSADVKMSAYRGRLRNVCYVGALRGSDVMYYVAAVLRE